MKKASGYIVADGRFFEMEDEAEFAEAEHALLSNLYRQKLKSTDRFIELLVGSMPEIRRYLDAYEAIAGRTPTSDDPEPDGGDAEWERDSIGELKADESEPSHIDQEDQPDTEDEATTVLELPPGVRKPMPNVGRHIKSATIRQQRPVNGPRGRRSNAPGVRDD